MIDVFFFSIAGKKSNSAIDTLIEKFLSEPTIPPHERKILEHTKLVSKEGSYPSKEYYDTFYKYQGIKYNSLSEIAVYCKSAIDFYKLQDYNKKTLTLINEANTPKDFVAGITKIIESQDSTNDDCFEDYHPITYSDVIDKPETKGCTSGIPEIDALTNGFQDYTIASICAFTGHGKSTEVVSMMFKNALQGKKAVLFSLELSPDLVWMQFQARYLYEVKGLQITAQDLIMRKLTSEMKNKVKEYDEDYRRDITNNIMILDESYLSKSIMLNPSLLKSLLKKCELKMGGLDLIAFDHVGQFELMWPDCGNQIIRAIQVVTKTYKTEEGEGFATIFAVQTNREGLKRAARRNGLYDLLAISDLNECVHPDTTLPTKVDGKRCGIVTIRDVYNSFHSGEQVKVLTPSGTWANVTNAFKVRKETEWYRLEYYNSGNNKLFTKNHPVFVNGVKTKLEDLPDTFNADCINYDINFNAKEIPSVNVKSIPKSLTATKHLVTTESWSYNITVDAPTHQYVIDGGLVTSNCERSSTYCIFMYTSDEMKIVQETKVCMLKHRLGSVLPEPITVTFNPAVVLVGSTSERMAMSAEDFADMDGLDFADMDDDF